MLEVLRSKQLSTWGEKVPGGCCLGAGPDPKGFRPKVYGKEHPQTLAAIFLQFNLIVYRESI